MKTLFRKKTLLTFSLCSLLFAQSLTPVYAAAITPGESSSQQENADTQPPSTEDADSGSFGATDKDTETAPFDSPATETTNSSVEMTDSETENRTDADTEPVYADSETKDSQTSGSDLVDEDSEADHNLAGANSLTEEPIDLADAVKADSGDVIENGYRIRIITPGECARAEITLKDSPTSAGVTQTVSDVTKLLRKYLNEARTQATDELPTKIIVEPGVYLQTSALRIYSNTYLYMDGVTILSKNTGNMLITGVTSNDVKQSGYCYRNITIDGGLNGCVWNKNFVADSKSSSTTIKVGHTQNFTMKNCTLMNTLNAHFMEVTGINYFTLQKCTFKNQILETTAKTKTYEAIQFDVLVPGHINGFDYELLKSQNITIDSCKFTNVARGIGSHNAILNLPLENISITNCTFDMLTSSAIQGMDWKNCTISGNYMTNVPRGITLLAPRKDDTYLPSTIAANGGAPSTLPDTYTPPAINQNIAITNNTIYCSGTDAYVPDYDCSGILLWGTTSNGTPSSAGTDTLPAGNYYLSGVTVTGNKISAASGVVMRDVYHSTVSGNTLSCPFSTGTNYYGILSQNGCTDITLSANTIQYFPTAGILCQVGDRYQIKDNSLLPQGDGIVFQWITDSSITGNTVNNMGVGNSANGGIRIQHASTVTALDNNKLYNYIGTALTVTDSASVVSVCKNTIEGCRYYGIYLANASVSKIEGNTLKTCGSSSQTESYAAITVAAGGKATSIKQNTITNSRQAGIQIAQGEVTTVSSNTITSPARYGIELNQGKVRDINSNTIKTAGNYSIVVYNDAKVNEINKNKITSGKAIGIHIASTTSALTVDANTVKNCQTAQIFINRSKKLKAVTVSNNKITGSSKKQEGIRIDSGNVILSKNTMKTCRYAVLFKNASSVKGTVYPNTFTKNKYNSIRYDNISYKNLAAPTSLKAANAGAKKIKLSWKASKKISGYVISRSKKKNTGFKQVGTVSFANTSYTNKKLKKNTKYYYTVAAYRTTEDGNLTFYSNPSKVVARKTPK